MTKSIGSDRADSVEFVKYVVAIFCFYFGVYLPYPVQLTTCRIGSHTQILLNESDETIHAHHLPSIELYLHHCTCYSIDRW